MEGLEQARQTINAIDEEMARLFVRRMQACEQVAAYKSAHQLPILDPSREKAILDGCAQRLDGQRQYLPYYRQFVQTLMDLSKQYQQKLITGGKVAYQGTEGAYSHITLQRLYPNQTAVGYPTFKDVFCAVAQGEADLGVLPFENSYTGDVGEILDLLRENDLYINQVYDLKISQALLGVPGSSLTTLREVYSHTQGLMQCQQFLDAYHLVGKPYSNTALAAKYISECGDPAKAAIASTDAARRYGLTVLLPRVSTAQDNTTRFIIIGRTLPAHGSRFSLLFTLRHEAGQLASVMQRIGARGFNLECIKSRPLRNAPWQYYFYVEVVGNAGASSSSSLLEELRAVCTQLRVLGVYDIETGQ